MQITSKGKLGVIDGFPHIDPDPIFYNYDRSSLGVYGETLALYFFAKFLDSPYSLHLARCDDCEMYFAYERARKTRVKNGVHCESCKVFDSVKRTKSRRGELTGRLIEAAVSARMRWKKSHSYPDPDAWVLEQVNEEFKTVLIAFKKKRWLSTHRDVINKEVERRKNVTRKN